MSTVARAPSRRNPSVPPATLRSSRPGPTEADHSTSRRLVRAALTLAQQSEMKATNVYLTLGERTAALGAARTHLATCWRQALP